jgi:hypothetical protein
MAYVCIGTHSLRKCYTELFGGHAQYAHNKGYLQKQTIALFQLKPHHG